MQYLLGVDIGTTGTKTLLFREDGKLMGGAYCPYAANHPAVGRSEQNPLDWWNAVVQTVRQVCRDPEIATCVKAISLSTQGGTMVPVDRDFLPVRPAMVWDDIRCDRESQRFAETLGADTIYRKTGWELAPGQNLMQIRWMKDHEPELFEKTAMFLSVPDYISYKMTGIAAVDLSNAGINQLTDIVRRDYDQDLMDFAGITREQLPHLVPTGQAIGALTPNAARELGLPCETLLVAGAHDQYAVATGASMTQPGDLLIGSGTSWVVTSLSDTPGFDRGLAQSVSGIPGLWGSLLALSSGGNCLEWLRTKVAPELSYDEINLRAAERAAAENGLFFYPFSGQCEPGKRFERGTFLGLDLSHDRFHMARAVMEGIAFQIKWMMEAFPSKPSQQGIKLAGGATKSTLWCQILADVLNLPVQIPDIADLACVGAAIQAGVGCGLYPDMETGCRTMTVEEQIVYPNPEQAARYAAANEQYRRCARTLGELYSG